MCGSDVGVEGCWLSCGVELGCGFFEVRGVLVMALGLGWGLRVLQR